ncbi:MAG: hypothetical protein F4Y08_17370 [Caldilineaceae bacterium SB0662_bin_9]|uniref:Uncharacterized protein n=1 Tax=Caldilineaceae bacterium SB0662_bin_9 TaxID=2605258 RepID=A0A6B1DZN9_9CHLR|nr:hypothetical protein [Caldilineaceae bacterium SB0662_bin_9]
MRPIASRWVLRLLRMLVALLASVFVWLIIISQQDPMIVRTIANVPVPCPDLQDTDLQCADVNATLTIRVRSPQSRWADLQPPYAQYLEVLLRPADEEHELTSGVPRFLCDAASREPSLQVLSVRASTAPAGAACAVDIALQSSPEVLAEALALQEQSSLFPVTLVRVGDLPDGYVLEGTTLNTTHTMITGPQEDLTRLDRAVAYLPFYSTAFTINAGSFELPLSVQAVDSNGNALTALTADPGIVLATVRYSSLPNTRRVRVILEPSATVAAGYSLEEVRTDPEFLLLRGPRDVLESVPDPLPLNPEEPVKPLTRTTTVVASVDVPEGATTNTAEVAFVIAVDHVILDNTQKARAVCQVEHPDLVYEFTPLFMHLRGPFEAFEQLYAMEAAGEFAWLALFDCPAEQGTWELAPVRFVFADPAVESSSLITLVSHDPAQAEVVASLRSALVPSS